MLSTSREIVILVVDDEVIVRNIVQRILTQAGFAVLAAADGQEALEVFQAFPDTIDMLLTDIDMPRLDGFPRKAHSEDSVHVRQAGYGR